MTPLTTCYEKQLLSAFSTHVPNLFRPRMPGCNISKSPVVRPGFRYSRGDRQGLFFDDTNLAEAEDHQWNPVGVNILELRFTVTSPITTAIVPAIPVIAAIAPSIVTTITVVPAIALPIVATITVVVSLGLND